MSGPSAQASAAIWGVKDVVVVKEVAIRIRLEILMGSVGEVEDAYRDGCCDLQGFYRFLDMRPNPLMVSACSITVHIHWSSSLAVINEVLVIVIRWRRAQRPGVDTSMPMLSTYTNEPNLSSMLEPQILLAPTKVVGARLQLLHTMPRRPNSALDRYPVGGLTYLDKSLAWSGTHMPTHPGCTTRPEGRFRCPGTPDC
nr:hypothetical protein CFP56_09424 [Quercus suber]